MYKIIGADQKEYGPISVDILRQWISEGRLNAQSLVLPEGATEWKTLGSLPEFASVLAVAATAPPPLCAQAPQAIPAGDYYLDIGQCVSRAWNALMNNFGLVFAACLLFLLIQMAIGVVGIIPLIGPLVSICSIVITGPLMGGLYYFLLKVLRQKNANVGDLFAGFRLAFPQLILGYLVVALLILAAMLPGALLGAFPVYQMVRNGGVDAVNLIWAIFAFFVVFVPAVYLQICWFFVPAVIIDRNLDFWTAIKSSRARVSMHWWLVFGLMIVGGLLNVVGELACCVGLLVSIPLSLLTYMCGYEAIFTESGQKSG